MLKLIRLFPKQDLFALKGFGCPPESTLIGSLSDARTYLIDRIGVQASEVRLAEQYLTDRPDHNAVEFGVMNLAVTCISEMDVSELHRKIGMGPSGLPN